MIIETTINLKNKSKEELILMLNESLRVIEKLQKENEELKQDRNNNYQMIALAQNEMLGYIQGYKDGKKLKRSAVACVVENRQYYIIKKEIEHYKEYIEKLQKENEELKERIREHTLLISPYYVKENFISVQKVKDKIEKLNKKEKEELKGLKGQDRYFVKQIYQYEKKSLQELLEGRK